MRFVHLVVIGVLVLLPFVSTLQHARNTGAIEFSLKRYTGYNVEVLVGTPPQLLSVEFDTGFASLVLPGQNFPGCGISKGFSSNCFLSTNSTSFRTATCKDLPSSFCTNCQDNNSADEECIPAPDVVLFDAGTWQWGIDAISFESGPQMEIAFLVWESPNNVSDEGGLEIFDSGSYFGGDLGAIIPAVHLVPQPPDFTSVIASLPTPYSQTWSFCLNQSGGALMFGEMLPYIQEPMQFLSLPETSVPQADYIFNLNDVYVYQADNKTKVSLLWNSTNTKYFMENVEQEQFWIGPDSGTATVREPGWIADNFQTFLTSFCKQGVNLIGVCEKTIYGQNESLFDAFCYQMSAIDIQQFPIIYYEIASAVKGHEDDILTLPFSPFYYLSNYVPILSGLSYQRCKDDTFFGMMIANIPELPPISGGVVLGSAFLQQYVVGVTSQGDDVQMGWAKAEGCPN